MSTIRPYAAGAYLTQRNTQQILDLKNQLGTLTTQLSTGRTAETYAGLGVGRTTSLTAHATISALDGYDAAIGYGQTRAQLATSSLTAVIDFGTDLKSNLANGLVRSSSGSISSATLARNALDAAVDALNQTGAGTYIFGGRDSETEPVVDTDTLLNGTDTKAGVAKLVEEQRKADLGADGMGRLGTALTGTTLSISENASAEVRANFGFTLAGKPVTTGTALTVSSMPADTTATFAAPVTEGQRFRALVQLADGSSRSVEYYATNQTAPDGTTAFPVSGDLATDTAKLATLLPAGASLTGVQAVTPHVTFNAEPAEGQSFRVVVNQPDGSRKTIDFQATAHPGLDDPTAFKLPLTGATLPDRLAAAATQLERLVAPGTLASVQSAPLKNADGSVKLDAGGNEIPAIGLSFSTGSPAAVQIGPLTQQPAVGDSITLKLALHDGTTTSVTLTARAATGAGSTAAPGTFEIVPGDVAATAGNLKTALDAAVKLAAGSSLSASATVRATSDFFDGSSIPGLAARRITFDTAGNATGYVETPSADTVQWYRGEDARTDPRATATVQTGANSTAQIGVRANEAPLRAVLAGMATVVLGTPSGSDPDANAKWQAMADRAGALVRAVNTSPSVQEIVTDLSLANTAMSNAKSQNGATRNIMENAMAGVEAADTTEVTTKLLDLQNRLQASYQVTATLSKLSLVNYMN
ncbi:hypothetical protein [Methylobacterium gregans]|uniref:Flagellin N-terminal domain-containing protein n=1 Tax=Methylobacterium gregans TaxID=374424 RepID=A0AA37MCX3_9HYPH|nr:hypothetical protein [Methylobacterium gregans]MDQ0520291.1 flagellin-like hook-associated protein FlgL [Methylobacterium gregans]GJD81885.1 hypothetical protein NBEOAGPD_5141 [Methylobacterium gregans]GLS52694.1 flagellar protein [Methylobacterium gregans]